MLVCLGDNSSKSGVCARVVRAAKKSSVVWIAVRIIPYVIDRATVLNKRATVYKQP